MEAKELEAKKAAAGEVIRALAEPILKASESYQQLLIELEEILTGLKTEAEVVSKKVNSHPPVPMGSSASDKLVQRITTLRQRQERIQAVEGSLRQAYSQIGQVVQDVFLQTAQSLIDGKSQIDRAFDAYNQALIEYAGLAEIPVDAPSGETVPA